MPLHLICGFLGSGKTTLLRRLLDQQPPEERLAIMVNEFGELGIDGQILDGFDSQVLEVTGGCICCTLKTNFIAGLNWLLDEFKPDRIIVEASGLAEAGSLAQMAQGVESLKRLALISVVTVVDADFFTCREGMGSLYFDQIKTAGLILLNKTDLVPAGEVEDLARAVAEINPTARILPVVHCALDRETIFSPSAKSASNAGQPAPGLAPEDKILPSLTHPPGHDGHEHKSTEGFTAFQFCHPGRLGRDCLKGFLAGLPWGVIRLKGFVRLEEGMFLLNYTYRRPEITPVDDPGPTRLAFVSWQVDDQKILSDLERCLLP